MENAQIMIWFLSVGEGAQWNNFHQPGTVDDNFSLLDSMIMLWVDTVIYMLIAWYVDNINPGDAGVAQPPWFVFLVSIIIELQHEISNNVVCPISKASDQPTHTRSLI